MRKTKLAILAASAAFIGSTPVVASNYNFTYNTDVKALAGSFGGRLGSDNNTFSITGLNYITVNGLPVIGSPSVVGTDCFIFGSGGSPIATLDLSELDFTVTSGSNESFIVGVGDRLSAVLGAPVTELTTLYGGSGSGRVFDSAAYSASISAVPEPETWAMMFLGLGAVGFAMRRRQNVTTRVSYAG